MSDSILEGIGRVGAWWHQHKSSPAIAAGEAVGSLGQSAELYENGLQSLLNHPTPPVRPGFGTIGKGIRGAAGAVLASLNVFDVAEAVHLDRKSGNHTYSGTLKEAASKVIIGGGSAAGGAIAFGAAAAATGTIAAPIVLGLAAATGLASAGQWAWAKLF